MKGDHGLQLKVFWETLMRRWYFVLLALVCTALASLLTIAKVGPTYEAKGAVLILPPVTSVQQSRESLGNPYFMLDGLTAIRDIVIHSIMAQDTKDELCRWRATPDYERMRVQLCRRNPGVSYEAEPDFTNNAPIILVTVNADSATNAAVGLNAVRERVPRVLSDLQAGLRLGPNAEITSMPLTADSKPAIVHKSQVRAGIVAGAGTLALCLLIIGLVDGLLATRRSKGARFKRARVVAMAVAAEREDGVDTAPQADPQAGFAPQAEFARETEPEATAEVQPETATKADAEATADPEPEPETTAEVQPKTATKADAEATADAATEAAAQELRTDADAPQWPLYNEYGRSGSEIRDGLTVVVTAEGQASAAAASESQAEAAIAPQSEPETDELASQHTDGRATTSAERRHRARIFARR